MTRVILAAFLAAASLAAQAADFYETAQVVDVQPIYVRGSQPRQECWTEYEPVGRGPQEHSYGGAVIGGVAGGVVGNQIGRGSGRTAATAVGAATGAMIGDRAANPDGPGVSGGTIAGGLVGGLIGSQVGRGHGRDAATAVGAVTGALVGSQLSSGNPPQADYSDTRPVQHCRQVDDGSRQEISGYSVTYRYHGRDITTTMPYDPGPTVRIGVGVER